MPVMHILLHYRLVCYKLIEMNEDVYIKEHPDALGPISCVDPLPLGLPNARMTALSRLLWIWPEYLKEFPQSVFGELLWARYGVEHANHLTLEQLADFFNCLKTILMSIERKPVWSSPEKSTH